MSIAYGKSMEISGNQDGLVYLLELTSRAINVYKLSDTMIICPIQVFPMQVRQLRRARHIANPTCACPCANLTLRAACWLYGGQTWLAFRNRKSFSYRNANINRFPPIFLAIVKQSICLSLQYFRPNLLIAWSSPKVFKPLVHPNKQLVSQRSYFLTLHLVTIYHRCNKESKMIVFKFHKTITDTKSTQIFFCSFYLI